jgi:hypothetical protein
MRPESKSRVIAMIISYMRENNLGLVNEDRLKSDSISALWKTYDMLTKAVAKRELEEREKEKRMYADEQMRQYLEYTRNPTVYTSNSPSPFNSITFTSSTTTTYNSTLSARTLYGASPIRPSTFFINGTGIG